MRAAAHQGFGCGEGIFGYGLCSHRPSPKQATEPRMEIRGRAGEECPVGGLRFPRHDASRHDASTPAVAAASSSLPRISIRGSVFWLADLSIAADLLAIDALATANASSDTGYVIVENALGHRMWLVRWGLGIS